ncbi:MAG: hypothetical protein ACE5FF_10970, partial [Saprospiraceae bacterium]
MATFAHLFESTIFLIKSGTVDGQWKTANGMRSNRNRLLSSVHCLPSSVHRFSSAMKKISSALISVYHKEGLEEIVRELHRCGVTIYSTGGTQAYIENLGVPVETVEGLTGYPS